MLTRLFLRRSSRRRMSTEGQTLLNLSELNAGSVLCSLVQTAEGIRVDEELGQALLFGEAELWGGGNTLPSNATFL